MRFRPLTAGLVAGVLALTLSGQASSSAAPEQSGQLRLASADVSDIQTLEDSEAIKQLKARYCRLLDTKQWQAWRGVFTDDFVSDTSEAGGKVINGADNFVAFVRQTLGSPSQTTAHQVVMPEITLTSATTATGIWALEDWVDFTPVLGLHGHGHYHETYVKVNGRWFISSSKLTRIRQQIVTPAAGLSIPDLKKTVEEALGH